MTLEDLLDKLANNETVTFEQTMAVIADNYDYTPSEFSNGLGDDVLINAAGTNEGSCKIFAFAKLHDLTAQQTLALFGDYYRIDVLENPDGSGHQNIRNFMRFGWDGIKMQGLALNKKIT